MKYIIWMIVVLLWTPCMAATSTHTTKSHTKHHYTPSHKKVRHHATTKITHSKSKVTKNKKASVHKQVRSEASEPQSIASLGGPIRPIVTTPSPYASFVPSFMTSIEHRLVEFVSKTVNNAKYTAYKLGGRQFDASRGVYVLDCSDYVDNVLAAVHPKAYWTLADSAGSEKPTSQHYYEFFSELGEYPSNYWNKVNEVEGLEPGDILVFRKKTRYGRNAGGHVMVVMNKPVLSDDAYLVRVADSAPSGHSADTRQSHTSGIGIGTMLLKVNPKTGKPSAYAWKVGSRWTGNVNIAMARPVAQA